MHDLRELADATSSSGLQSAFRSWSALLERLPIGVYVCDRQGLLINHNRRAGELWGRGIVSADGLTRYCGALRAFDAKGEPLRLEDSPIARVLRTGEPVRDCEIIIEQPDGARLTLLSNAEPLFDETGDLVGAVNCVQNITELRMARDQLRERAGWGRRIVEHSPIAIYTTDGDGRLMSFNSAAAELWGREPVIGEDRWCGSHALYHPDGSPMPLGECPMAQAIRSGQPVEGAEAIFERPDGSRGAFLAYPTPLVGSDGKVAGAMNMLVDISGRKAAEDLQKSLLDELNHRVKNTLATVQSLAAHSFREDRDADEMRRSFEARLMALSHAHNQLAARNWEAADLAQIAEAVLAPYHDADGRLDPQGPSTHLSAPAAVTLAMVLHELATNAVKYGALSQPDGRLSVRWEAGPEGAVKLVWRESGGPAVNSPSRRGFGVRFIEGALTREMGGEARFEFAPDGLCCTISFRRAVSD
ncbi:sensor histidine kinase [Phenylobacterium sp.]|uniref:sensor histidine kinase n=1 Tax=Phenylobacterium sp. TaxID=1871053 RepID=UPI003BA927DB